MTNWKISRRNCKTLLLCASAFTSATFPHHVAAQDAAPAANDEDIIIVTGTSQARTAQETPVAITSIDNESIARLTASGQADILNSIPSIKADGGGGEVAANVFVKGLPSGGQYQFTPLMYDGVPVMSTFGLNSSAFDVYYRNDLAIDRLEFVRGGAANLFGPGSVAGLINYITRDGSDVMRGTVQLEVAEADRYRGDVAVSGPLAENLFYSVAGFYRSDKGPYRTNLDTEGFQVRGNLKMDFADGSGFVKLQGQYIDDEAVFYLPVPLDGQTRKRALGNDGERVNSVFNDFSANLGFNTPDGPFLSDINDGVATQGGQVALIFEKDFGAGWGFNGRLKYSDYDHKFGLWLDGDGVINVPETLQSFLTNRGLGSVANADFTFTDGSGVVPADFLLFANRFVDRDRPMEDFSAEVNLTKDFSTGGAEHTLTLGSFYADTKAGDVNVTTTYLAEFNNQPRLVDLVVTNPTTNAETIISRNGLLNAGTGYSNNDHQAERYAIYIADQIKGERINFDIGFRYEEFIGDISRERTATFITDASTPNLSAALRDVVWGNGIFQTGRVKTDAWALAAGALYKLTDDLNVYANASRGYFFPEIRSVGINALGETASFSPEIIKQAEVGVKFSRHGLNFSVAGLYTKLDNRRQVLFVNDGQGGLTEKVNIVATRAWGLETTLAFNLADHLQFNGNLTLQDAEYTDFDTAPGNVGNELERQPNLLYNAGLYYDDDTFDAAIFTNYTGDNFTAASNTIELEGFNVVNLDAGYKIPVGGNSSVRVGINVFNLLDSEAVTEGSPRQDSNQTAGSFFVGRPILPRRITGRVTFTF